MNRELELRALAWEARRRGVHYGDVQGLPRGEVERILGEFKEAMNTKDSGPRRRQPMNARDVAGQLHNTHKKKARPG